MMQNLIFDKNERIAWLKLNRPQSFNAMNNELVDELQQALLDAEKDEDIRVIVLTGEGKAFCAGGDLSYLESLHDVQQRTDFIEKVGLLTKTITLMSKPIIAMVNGVAAGAGANLMLACDLIYASENAKFAQSFLKVGLIPDCGGLYFLPKAIGIHKAKELMFTADLINATEALSLGMINKVFSPEKLFEETRSIASRLVTAPPLALSLTKTLLNKTNLELDDILVQEKTAQALCMSTNDALEGISAFKEKRVPQFSGK